MPDINMLHVVVVNRVLCKELGTTVVNEKRCRKADILFEATHEQLTKPEGFFHGLRGTRLWWMIVKWWIVALNSRILVHQRVRKQLQKRNSEYRGPSHSPNRCIPQCCFIRHQLNIPNMGSAFPE